MIGIFLAGGASAEYARFRFLESGATPETPATWLAVGIGRWHLGKFNPAAPPSTSVSNNGDECAR